MFEEITTYNDKLCTPSQDFIWGRNIPDEVCDGLIDFWRDQSCLQASVGKCLRHGLTAIDRDFKESLDMAIPLQITDDRVQTYLLHLQQVLDDYMERFPMCETSEFRIVEPLNMQWYPPGGGFKQWHSERANCKPGNIYRHLVFMTYLNDVPDGGTEWYHQQKYVDAKKGYTVLWPSDWTHFHRGRVSHEHEKVIMTGWFSYV